MAILENIDKQDVKSLDIKNLETLSGEIRERIISVIGKNGGHFASNMGIVDTTVALYSVFDFPTDKLIFDVGHQCYAHKILSGRFDKFDSIRTYNGLSGFPDKDESVFDTFTSGHAGNSIAECLGLCEARDALGEDYYVVDIVGDGSIINGLNLEAISASSKKPTKLIIILNDNGMSISKNKNGLYGVISKLSITSKYVRSKNFVKKVFGKHVLGFLRKVRGFIKRLFSRGRFFERFGFKYIGVVNGNDLKEMQTTLKKVKELAKYKAVLLHINTTKGKGYEKAEEQAELYHGIGKNFSVSQNGFGVCLGEKLISEIEKDKKIKVITAGMTDGTGLKALSEKFPDNFYDVGIAEEYAVTFASGLSAGGLKPFVCIYSTFLQRAYDQILHDVCLQNLPVVFCLDRAGLVGEDGKTHQGIFDLSYLSHLPNMTVLAPNTKEELFDMVDFALKHNGPVAIRYPKSLGDSPEFVGIEQSPWKVVKEGKDLSVIAVGPKMLDLAIKFSSEIEKNHRASVQVISARTVKPLDQATLSRIKAKRIFTLEENSVIGGFGSLVENYFGLDKTKTVEKFGVNDKFVKSGSIDLQLSECGLSVENLTAKYLI